MREFSHEKINIGVLTRDSQNNLKKWVKPQANHNLSFLFKLKCIITGITSTYLTFEYFRGKLCSNKLQEENIEKKH